MRVGVSLYKTMQKEDLHPVLVKEKEIAYGNLNFHSGKEVADMMNALFGLGSLAEEYCYLLALSTKGRVLAAFLLSKGNISQTFVNTRDIFIRLLLAGAAAFVICHNHPSQEAEPSMTDRRVTEKLERASELMDVDFLDHIIVCRDGYYSFRENGWTAGSSKDNPA